MQPEEMAEMGVCMGAEGMTPRTERYMREALGIEISMKDAQPGGVLEQLFAWVQDYLTDRRALCKRIASERSEGGHLMRSLRADPLIPFRPSSTYDPIGRRAEFPLATEIRRLTETERRLTEIAAAWKRDHERS